MSATKTRYYRCLQHNPPEMFLTKDALNQHWQLNHTVNQVLTEADPWGQRAPRTKSLVDEVDV